MKKRITALALACVMVLGTAALAAGTEKSISVTPMNMSINGQEVTPLKSNGDHAEVFAYDGATYVPLRYLSELLGIEVQWDKDHPNTATLVNVPNFTAPAGGAFTGTGSGFGGEITATITVEGGKITACTLTGEGETPAIGGAALPKLQEQVLAAGSAEIDGVSGATMTSNGVKAALAAALSQATGDTAPKAMKAGTYEASAKGQNGPVTVSVTVDETSIKAVEVKEHKETRGIGDYAVNAIPTAIVEAQTLQVDTLTGATVTSAAILAAARDCLTQAGANATAFSSKVSAPAPKDTAYTCDVVVAGAGAAGLSAAYEAAKAGAKVILVEKQSIPGGSTARSGGSIQAAATKLQASLGVKDTPEAFAQFLIDRGEGHVNEEKLTLLAKKSSSTIDWLESLGVTFAPELQALHRTIKPDRGHSAKEHAGVAAGAGGELTDLLYQACQKEGVTFLFDTPAVSLIQSGKTVTGVTCRNRNGSTVTVSAKAVVLATGGFDKNPELVAQYAPISANAACSVPNGNVGDGLIMARDAGAKIVAGGGAVVLYMDMTTFSGESGGLFVLADGSRFMDESSFWFVRTKTLMDLGQNKVFFITDASTDKNGNYETLAKDGKIFAADSPEALAQQLGMEPATLAATVRRYNDLCAKGKDEDFGKGADFLKSVDTKRIYAIPFRNNSSGTFGGPITDMDGRVLATDDTVIPGLYAAGEVANGDLLWQEYPGSGTSLSIDFTFGRIAGQTAAKDVLS